MNVPADHTTISRATSRASGRSKNSTLSRNQSLIKRNIELQDLKPADVLIERFVAWKVIVQQLTSYFEGIADIENNTAKELTKLAGVIQVPFRAGNQFLGEGGLQDIYYDIRDKTRIVADQHADLGRTVDSSIVQHLQKLRAEIKAHIKNVQNDTGKLAAGVAKEREFSTKLVGELANDVSTFKNTPMNIQPKNDPYVANQAVARQLQRQVLEENLLQKSIVMMQQNSAHFEEGIVRSIQSAWQTFDEWQSRASAASQEIFRSLSTHLGSLAPDREWIQFAARSDHLLDPDTPLRDPELISYPLKDDPSVVPVHTGHLERKKRFTRSYTECYFVLTPAGFLHEFASSDPTSHAGLTPSFSLFLPSCTLGPASPPSAKANKFHIEGRKDGLGTTKSGSFKGLLGGEGNKAWSFRARSREDMMEWWNDIRMLCARYLVSSEQVDRTGPVESAVRSAGYTSEDLGVEELTDEEEEEEEEEERVITADEHRRDHDGSSVEEEAEVGVYEETAPPGYTRPEKHVPVEIGPNGYAIEKKYGMGGYAPPPSHHRPAHARADAQQANGTGGVVGNHHVQPAHPGHDMQPQQVQAELAGTTAPAPIPLSTNNTGGGGGGGVDPDTAAGTGTGTGTGRGAKRVRRLSKRQMEKAPEGRGVRGLDAPIPIRGHDDDDEYADMETGVDVDVNADMDVDAGEDADAEGEDGGIKDYDDAEAEEEERVDLDDGDDDDDGVRGTPAGLNNVQNVPSPTSRTQTQPTATRHSQSPVPTPAPAANTRKTPPLGSAQGDVPSTRNVLSSPSPPPPAAAAAAHGTTDEDDMYATPVDEPAHGNAKIDSAAETENVSAAAAAPAPAPAPAPAATASQGRGGGGFMDSIFGNVYRGATGGGTTASAEGTK